MPTPTDDRRELLTVIASMRAAEGRTDELRRELEALVPLTAAEVGYVNYDLHQGVEDRATFVLYENWTSAAHLDAHLATPHLVRFAGLIPALLDEKGLSITRLQRIA